MLDFLHWSAALLALLALGLWFWSAHPIGRLKRPIRRIAICAAVISALIQAGTPASPVSASDIVLWASAAPSGSVSPIG